MNYDWRDFSHLSLRARFPTTDVRGSQVWAQTASEAMVFEERSARSLFEDVANRFGPLLESRPLRLTPTVFVSHRHADAALAASLATDIKSWGYDVWLDIWDPQLQSVPPGAHPAVIAAIIEMALLNSTHVLAVMTANTKGSSWVPYEYGRVKGPGIVDWKAAAWLDPNNPPANPIPEYLHLGALINTRAALHAWL